MSGAIFASLAPLAVLGLTVIVALLMAPRLPMQLIRAVTGAGLALAFVLVAARWGAAPAPYAPLLADDGLARFGAGLTILAGLATLAFLRESDGAREGPALLAIAVAGGVALTGAAHGATLFLGLEIMTLALVALTLLPRTDEAVEAGYKLFLVAGAGAAALLLGIAFALAGTGSLALADWGGAEGPAAIGAALVLAALAVKFALVPFHMWAPDLFSGAPPSAASLAGAVSKVAVAVAFLRLAAAPPGGPLWEAGLALAGGAAVLLGNLVALRQESLVRMLGYSSVAHSGYLALVLGAGHPLTGDVVLFYAAAYAPAVVAALCVAALVGPGATRESLRGLVWARPVAGVALAVALLSMAGLPPAVGFLGKVYMFTALAGAEAWLSLAAAALGSGLGFLYYLRFAVVTFAAPDAAGPLPALARPDALALAGCLAVLLVAGLYPEPLLALARAAAP